MALSVSAPGALSPGDFVAGFVDASGVNKLFWDEAAGAPLNGIADSLPAVASCVQVQDPQGGATGPWKLVLTPSALDTVNASSVMQYELDQRVLVLVASTNNG